MAGKLYLVATPIGNLEDMTYRAVRILKEVNLIAAEDTRNSIRLLNHFDIKTPMTSYHEHNKYEKADELISIMLDGKDIAEITDAGTPGISDPGEELVKKCYDAGIEVIPVPVPSDKKERNAVLEALKAETRTIIIYEAPHRLLKTLKELVDALGAREATICRELTKKHETFFKTTLDKALDYYSENEPKGECIVIIKGLSREEADREREKKWEEISIPDHLKMYIEQGKDKKEAAKLVAKDRGVSKRDIYEFTIDL